jgi:glutamate/tyrosine decarboxylase-like PLP-dependent enzyme
MGPEDVRLPDAMSERLAERAGELLKLGTLTRDEHTAAPGEQQALAELAERLRNTYPYPDPHYAGQMLKPPVALAWAAYATAMLLNPNNHALDGGPATAEMEKDAVAQLAAMFDLEQHLGHLTSSGTIANLEALWVARELHPDAAILSGENAHYTHGRVSAVLGARHETVGQDAAGRMDLDALEARLRGGGVGTVVATPGTTALGAVDAVDAIADLCAEHGARLHVDAAYGGFFRLLADGGDPGVATAPFAAIARADSVVIDPHKHGLQPYGCGCVLFADPAVGRLYAHDSPYTYFTSEELHLGEISLECSRAGAAAGALWLTLRALPLRAGEGLGPVVAAGLRAARAWAALIEASEELCLYAPPELDILLFWPHQAARSCAAVDAASAALLRAAMTDPSPVYLSTLRLPAERLRRRDRTLAADADQAQVLRSVLMKPEHEPYVATLHREVVRVARSLAGRA